MTTPSEAKLSRWTRLCSPYGSHGVSLGCAKMCRHNSFSRCIPTTAVTLSSFLLPALNLNCKIHRNQGLKLLLQNRRVNARPCRNLSLRRPITTPKTSLTLSVRKNHQLRPFLPTPRVNVKLWRHSSLAPPKSRLSPPIRKKHQFSPTLLTPRMNLKPWRHNRQQPLSSQPHQPCSAQIPSQPTNPQEASVQPNSSKSTDEPEAMAPQQPLRSQPHQPRSAQIPSQPTNPQEPSAQAISSNTAGEHEAIAPQQPRSAQTQSQPENRHIHESSAHGNQSQQPSSTNSQDREDRFRVAQMALDRLTLDLPQRTTDFLVTQPINPMDLVLLCPMKLSNSETSF
ncbi:LOW QUALITY PROTEIN: alpha-l-fucosidase [Plakobranchus ocellatus]|uniref:Alpha-l-fucosidase n=1 Tax=Plakobranchus ocellatus TaxID=259542 RepID=A0AAV3YK15_9GAST|nr:LOW QUALITY PROTEIN: alpha-l-fucosidase [Plakobranchus ocellatus]